MQNNIIIQLPNNNITSQFNTYNDNDKINIIDYGIKLHQQSSIIIHSSINNKNKENIDNIIKTYENKIKNLQTIIDKQIATQQEIKDNYNSKLTHIQNQIQNATELTYKSKIEQLQTQLDTLQNNINQKDKTIQELNNLMWKNINEKQNQLRSQLENKYEDKIKTLQDTIDNERNKLIENHKRTQNSTLIGQDGEIFIEGKLNMFFPTCEIESTGKQSSRGDFILKHPHNWIMIENKKYSKNVLKVEIDKFYKDMHLNNDIASGLFCSLSSGICNRKDFQLEIVDGKPIIFLANVYDNLDKIKIAVDVLNTLTTVDKKILDNKEKLDAINNIIKEFHKNQKKSRKIANDQYTKLINIFDKTDTLIKSLSLILK